MRTSAMAEATNQTMSRAASENGLPRWRPAWRSAEDIAQPSHCVDELPFEGIVDLGAQPANMDIDDIAVAVERHVPDLLRDERPRQHVALVLHEQRQQQELFGRELERRAAAHGAVTPHVEREIRILRPLVRRPAAAPQQRAHAGEQFREGEGLDQVVVRAEIEPLDPVGDRIAHGQEKHRRLAAGAAISCQDRPAVALRQHDVQDEDGIADAERQLQRLFAVACDIDDETLIGEAGAQEGGGLRVVFRKQQFHCSSMPQKQCRTVEGLIPLRAAGGSTLYGNPAAKDYDRFASGPRNRAGLELSAALAADPDVDLSRFDAGSDEEQVELSLARRPAGARLGRALRREHAAGEGAAGRYRAVDARGPALSGLRSRSLLPGAAAARAWPRGRRSLAEARRP